MYLYFQTFLVRRSQRENMMAVSMRVGKSPNVEHFLIEQSPRGLCIQGSHHHFATIPILITFYCENKWVGNKSDQSFIFYSNDYT